MILKSFISLIAVQSVASSSINPRSEAIVQECFQVEAFGAMALSANQISDQKLTNQRQTPWHQFENLYKLESGTLHGIRETIDGVSVDSYFGVPYAKPPVGELRFQPTEKEDAWEGVLEASVRRPLCAQAMNCTGCEGYQISEDCLYLGQFL